MPQLQATALRQATATKATATKATVAEPDAGQRKRFGFVKEVFRPGVYRKGDAEYRITREDVRRFFSGLKKLDNAGFDVPLVYEHPDGDAADPVPKTDWDRRADMVRNTAGKVLAKHPASRINERGALELAFEVTGDSAIRLLESGGVGFVSPQVRANFRDGIGREYGPVISHVALTHLPVQIDQEKGFRRVSLSGLAEPVCLSLADFTGEDAEATERETKVLDLSDDSLEKDARPGEDDGNPDMPADSAGRKKLQALLGHLAQIGLQLPSDTDAKNLVERLLTACMTYNACQQQREDEEQDENDELEEAVPPTISQYSLPAAKEKVESFAAALAESHKTLDKLCDAGYVQPGQRDFLRDHLGRCQFSDGAETPTLSISAVLEMLGKGQPMNLGVKVSDAVEHPSEEFIHGGEPIRVGDARAPKLANEILSRVDPRRKRALAAGG